MKKFLSLALLTASLAAAQAQLMFDNFNSNTVQFGNFAAQNVLGSDGLVWSSANGVANVSGRINAFGAGNHFDSVFYNPTGGSSGNITWTTGTTYSASIFFLSGTAATGNVFQVMSGFIRSTGSNFDVSGSSLYGQVRQDSSGNPYLRIRTATTNLATSSTFTLTSNLWYELETTMNLSSGTTGDFGVFLYTRGTDGTDPRTLVTSVTVTGGTLSGTGFNTSDFWSGFGGGNNSGNNIAAFDNFTVILEPSTSALLACGLAELTIFRRRRN